MAEDIKRTDQNNMREPPPRIKDAEYLNNAYQYVGCLNCRASYSYFDIRVREMLSKDDSAERRSGTL